MEKCIHSASRFDEVQLNRCTSVLICVRFLSHTASKSKQLYIF